MAQSTDAARAVEAVFRGALEGSFDATPLAGRHDLRGGLEIQLQVLERWRARGERLAGWKVGLTSGRSRDAFGPGFRPFGYILASRVFESGARIDRSRLGNVGIEPELCFRIGAPLRGEVTPERARDAVASVAAGFEINQRRPRGDADPAVRLADDLAQWGIVAGDEREVGSCVGLDVEVWRDGERVAAVGPDYEIDDHFLSIARLTAQLHGFGLGLEPGQRVITGAFSRHALDAPSRWRARFSGIGAVEIEVA